MSVGSPVAPASVAVPGGGTSAARKVLVDDRGPAHGTRGESRAVLELAGIPGVNLIARAHDRRELLLVGFLC